MIDLRSDTLTKPSVDMIKAMSLAEVGDDVFGEDKTTNELQEELAGLFGKEAGLFVPSGVMGNQLAIKSLTEPADEVIVEGQSHIFYYETAAPSVISAVQLRPVESSFGEMDLNDVEKAIRPKDYYFPRTKLVCIENTHNRHSGTIISLEYIKSLKEVLRKYDLKFHLDGARLWNAIVETGIKPNVWAECFDTVTVCFSKGLGAPVGSILLGSKEVVKTAHRWRKILGGGMRQIGVLTAACQFAVSNNLEKLKEDHENARTFATALADIEGISINLQKVQTNIVCFDLDSSIDINEFLNNCRLSGLMMLAFGTNTVRAVFNYHVKKEDTRKATDIISKHIVINRK
jgi:threonine aldolase